MEVEKVDILVALIGGRFGSGSQYSPYSISQMELKKALEAGKQVYIFIERSVMSEYRTYTKNSSREDIEYFHVDHINIFRFIEKIEALPNNNAIAPFEFSRDITTYLREQWAGLFQRLLQEQALQQQYQAIEEIRSSAQTLNDLVKLLTEERKQTDTAVKEILLINHPIFKRFKSLLRPGYRVFFTNRREMSSWLKVRSYLAVMKELWDDDNYEEWVNRRDKVERLLKISTCVFDSNGRLVPYSEDDWDDKWVTLSISTLSDDDNVDPFSDE